MNFERHRRLRNSANLRALVKETVLHKEDLIYPVFIVEGEKIENPVASMPGVYQRSIDLTLEDIGQASALGIKSVIVFGVPKEKDEVGSSAYCDHGIVQKGIKAIKEKYPELVVIADTCLCQFTDHGHCGVVRDGIIQNDESLGLLVQTAISQAKAGADIIAPSNMMDGFVVAIREGLDEAGYTHIPIMSYGVKYSSSFYGPFRDAAHSAPQFGDRKTYQMDPSNRREALREALADVEQGADFIIVKPALSYMDIIREVRNEVRVPVVAYNVSGEYSMVKAAAMNGWINERSIVMEMLTGMKRAGVDLIITYFAKDVATYIDEER